MPQGDKNNLSSAIRQALGVFGVEPGKEKSQQVKNWIKQNYPALGRKVEDKTFGSTLSIQRKKVAEVGSKTKTTKASPADENVAPAVAKPALYAAEAPRQTSLVDVEMVVQVVKELQELASRVGGKRTSSGSWICYPEQVATTLKSYYALESHQMPENPFG